MWSNGTTMQCANILGAPIRRKRMPTDPKFELHSMMKSWDLLASFVRKNARKQYPRSWKDERYFISLHSVCFYPDQILWLSDFIWSNDNSLQCTNVHWAQICREMRPKDPKMYLGAIMKYMAYILIYVMLGAWPFSAANEYDFATLVCALVPVHGYLGASWVLLSSTNAL
jgi:hypothetical protein